MKKKSDPDMRPEYDFSEARRSRYATRFSDERRREILRRSASIDAHYQFARALQQAQELEAVVVTSFVLALEQSLEAAGRSAAALYEGEGRDALSQLSSEIGMKQDFATRFTQFVAERNWLVHKSGLSLSPRVEEPERLAELVTRLEALTHQTADLSAELVSGLSNRLTQAGLSPQEVQKRTEDTIQRWRAA